MPLLNGYIDKLESGDPGKGACESLNELREEISRISNELDVTQGMDLAGDLERMALSLAHGNSEGAIRNRGSIIELLERIISGKYVEVDGQPMLIPNDCDKEINMKSASGSARAIFQIYDYITNSLSEGDLLIIDEPEMNLDPCNQILLARLFVLLANAGVRVLITTHSDFISREISNCIMLNILDDDQIEELECSYTKEHRLDSSKVKAYTTNPNENKKGRYSVKSVTPTECGIYTSHFDEAIASQNTDRDEIVRQIVKKKRGQSKHN